MSKGISHGICGDEHLRSLRCGTCHFPDGCASISEDGSRRLASSESVQSQRSRLDRPTAMRWAAHAAAHRRKARRHEVGDLRGDVWSGFTAFVRECHACADRSLATAVAEIISRKQRRASGNRRRSPGLSGDNRSRERWFNRDGRSTTGEKRTRPITDPAAPVPVRRSGGHCAGLWARDQASPRVGTNRLREDRHLQLEERQGLI